jgi:hypothetical protein
MDDKDRALAEKIIEQNDKIIDALLSTNDEKAFDVLGLMLENNGAVLDALFPQVRFIAQMAEEGEPPMMQ